MNGPGAIPSPDGSWLATQPRTDVMVWADSTGTPRSVVAPHGSRDLSQLGTRSVRTLEAARPSLDGDHVRRSPGVGGAIGTAIGAVAGYVAAFGVAEAGDRLPQGWRLTRALNHRDAYVSVIGLLALAGLGLGAGPPLLHNRREAPEGPPTGTLGIRIDADSAADAFRRWPAVEQALQESVGVDRSRTPLAIAQALVAAADTNGDMQLRYVGADPETTAGPHDLTRLAAAADTSGDGVVGASQLAAVIAGYDTQEERVAPVEVSAELSIAPQVNDLLNDHELAAFIADWLDPSAAATAGAPTPADRWHAIAAELTGIADHNGDGVVTRADALDAEGLEQNVLAAALLQLSGASVLDEGAIAELLTDQLGDEPAGEAAAVAARLVAAARSAGDHDG